MKTLERPDMTIAAIMLLRWLAGKFFATFAEDQSSTKREATRRIGMVRRLL